MILLCHSLDGCGSKIKQAAGTAHPLTPLNSTASTFPFSSPQPSAPPDPVCSPPPPTCILYYLVWHRVASCFINSLCLIRQKMRPKQTAEYMEISWKKYKQRTKKTFRSPQKMLTVEAEACLESDFLTSSQGLGRVHAPLETASVVFTQQDQPKPLLL